MAWLPDKAQDMLRRLSDQLYGAAEMFGRIRVEDQRRLGRASFQLPIRSGIRGHGGARTH